ncbi:MAG TPA: hypothetical protein VG777_04245, partial [Thermoanaerobaculia bacterium]|nr:hypothetical protein [Thermoanaerobaculia bacterium]
PGAVHCQRFPPRASRGVGRNGARMDERHAAILERLRTLTSELLDLSARNTSSLDDDELERLRERLEGIRSEIERLRAEFRKSLN